MFYFSVEIKHTIWYDENRTNVLPKRTEAVFMTSEEYRRRIIEMVNQLQSNSKLRRIYLILVAMIGGG